MRICFVNLGSLPALSNEHKHGWIGGEEIQHALLAGAFAGLGHDVSLVVADCGQPDGAVYDGVRTLRAFKESAGIPVVRFFYPRLIKLWSALARADAEIYYCSCAGVHVGLIAMFCQARGRRMVFRTASDADCDPLNLPVKHGWEGWFYKYGLRRTDQILVQTVTQQQALLKNFRLSGIVADMLVAPPKNKAPYQKKDIHVLWISNLREFKRPDRLLALAKAMPGYSFHMVGGRVHGEEDLYRSIETAARDIKNLTFHGAVPYLDVGVLFDRAVVFANTSDLEGFPNTFLQAWARGIPVVTLFDPDGDVRRFGLGSAHSGVEEMRAGLEKLLSDCEAYEKARSAALAFMSRRFGQADVLKPYLEAFAAVGSPTPINARW